jgi:hypothetical protein
MLCSIKAWSLPWFQTPIAQRIDLVQTGKKTAVSNTRDINFSGDWQGQCNNQPVIDISIIHKPDSITLSYGFMEEIYPIGVLKSESKSSQQQSESGSSAATWSQDENALIFINNQQYINGEGHMSVFFSKVAMSLEDDNLVINGDYFQSSNKLGDVIKDNLSCIYRRK